MAKHDYTPREWCKSATCLLYKPNKKDPHDIAYYRPIALMHGILKLWTSIFTNIGYPWAEAQGISSDIAYGFRRPREIYDSLSTYIIMYEDAKISRTHLYKAYSDLKGAFGGMDHRILFKTMGELVFPEYYTQTCEHIYRVSGTYYMTSHRNTPTIPIHRGTLQGDTYRYSCSRYSWNHY